MEPTWTPALLIAVMVLVRIEYRKVLLESGSVADTSRTEVPMVRAGEERELAGKKQTLRQPTAEVCAGLSDYNLGHGIKRLLVGILVLAITPPPPNPSHTPTLFFALFS